MSMGTSIVGTQTVSGAKIDSPPQSPFAQASTPTTHGTTNGTPQAQTSTPQIPAPKVSPLKKTPPLSFCSDAAGYRGEKPFQAIESALMSKYISTTLPKKHNIKTIAYLDFHSYSQSILYPFAYNCDVLPKDAEDIAEAAWGAAKAARTVHGRYFEVNSACEGDNFVVGQKREVRPPRPPHNPLAICRC
jgi:hypothetical protein